jgi:hypothetical protein
MFETLTTLLNHYGDTSKAVIWAHNSHIGDASATEMSARGEHNIGQLCRAEFGDAAYLIGLGTHTGTVAAASNWDGPMEIKNVRPSLPESYEFLFHALAESWASQGLLEYVPVISEALPEDGWSGRAGFVHRAVMQDFPDLSGHQVYACGVPVMVDAARRDFTSACRLPEDEFFADSFTTQADLPQPAPSPR